MKLYLENLIPRLKEFSLNLDKQEVFVDKQWVIIDENSNKQSYIFRRNGDLIMSINGQVTLGKWEYIAAAKSLLIDRVQDKILLNQNFIDPAVMILKKDGSKEDNLILANEDLIPDLDVPKYIKEVFYKNFNISTKELINGDIIEINTCKNADNTYFKKVSINGDSIESGKYILKDNNIKYLIENTKIVRTLSMEVYKTNKGEITIEQDLHLFPQIGDLVYQNDNIAPDGKYKLSFLDNIFVENGVLISKSLF